MKKLILAVSPLLFVLSCSKEQPKNTPVSLPKIKFTVNSKVYEWEGNFDGTQKANSSGVAILHNRNNAFPFGDGYLLYGYDTRGKKKVEKLGFAIAKDTSIIGGVLGVKDYKYPINVGLASDIAVIQFVYFGDADTVIAMERYFGMATRDYISVNITKIEMGRYNGSIKGKVSLYSDTTQKVDVNGSFENLRIVE